MKQRNPNLDSAYSASKRRRTDRHSLPLISVATAEIDEIYPIFVEISVVTVDVVVIS